VLVAAIVLLLAQFRTSYYERSGYTYGAPTEFQSSGWPAVNWVYDFDYARGRHGAPVVMRERTRRAPLGYAINGGMLLAILTLVWMVDRMVQSQQFALWRLFVVMLACSGILGCVRAASAHNLPFLEACGVPIDSPKPQTVLWILD
jgi:hypothetical protein